MKHRTRGHKTKGFKHTRVSYLRGEPGHYHQNCPQNQDNCVRKTSMKSNHKAQPAACTKQELPHDEPMNTLMKVNPPKGCLEHRLSHLMVEVG